MLLTAMQSGGAIVIIFSLVFILCSGLLVQGVRREYRGLFFPWMTCMTLVVLFQAVYGLWIIIGYYIVCFSDFYFTTLSFIDDDFYFQFLLAMECICLNLQLVLDGCQCKSIASFSVCCTNMVITIPFYSTDVFFPVRLESVQTGDGDASETHRTALPLNNDVLSSFYYQKVDPFGM